MDFTAVDKRIAALEATRAKPCKVSPTEPLAVGLDLGTAYIVLDRVLLRGEREEQFVKTPDVFPRPFSVL